MSGAPTSPYAAGALPRKAAGAPGTRAVVHAWLNRPAAAVASAAGALLPPRVYQGKVPEVAAQPVAVGSAGVVGQLEGWLRPLLSRAPDGGYGVLAASEVPGPGAVALASALVRRFVVRRQR